MASLPMSGFYPNSDHRRYSYPDPNNRADKYTYKYSIRWIYSNAGGSNSDTRKRKHWGKFYNDTFPIIFI
jgi:hypothetical protein